MAEPGVRYAISKTVNCSFDEAEQRVRQALQEEGFGVLTEIDVAATLKKKLGVDFPSYKILGACAPALAHRALQTEPDVGLLLPCNVVVRAGDGGGIVVQALDPVVQLGVAERAELRQLANEVRSRLERVIGRMAEG